MEAAKSLVVLKREFAEAAHNLVKKSGIDEPELSAVCDALGAIASEVTGVPMRVMFGVKKEGGE